VSFGRATVTLLCAVLAGPFVLPALGQLEVRSQYYTNSSPYSLVVGDFNGDGTPDAAVVNITIGSVQILLGNGDGTFRAGATYPFDAFFYAAAGSLRSNGILDLVVGGPDVVYVMLGNGDGTFQGPVSYPASAESRMVGLGDFTGYGKTDIIDLESVSTQGVSCNCLEVLPGNGDGTFGSPITTPVPTMSLASRWRRVNLTTTAG
jgi:hypothetical protein